MRVTAIVVAGGRGLRFGGLKQFADVNGLTLAERSVATARCVASKVVLVVPEGYDGNGEGADSVVTGGATRSDSVRAGLTQATDAEIIVIHDAARPLATSALFSAVVHAIVQGAHAAVPGLDVTDTLKRVSNADPRLVLDTVDRDHLVTVQTPQAFRGDTLRRAHTNGADATDDAALVEALGIAVRVVPGETTNIKVTHESDLEHVASRSVAS